MGIIDEATANLDSLTEAQILEIILDDVQNTTRNIITYRLVSPDQFDVILVMNQAQISERGTDRDLLNKGGL